MVAEAIRTEVKHLRTPSCWREDGEFFCGGQAQMLAWANETMRMTALRDSHERKLAEEALRSSEVCCPRGTAKAAVAASFLHWTKGIFGQRDLLQMLVIRPKN